MSEAAIIALLDPVARQFALEVDSIELLKAGSRTLLRVYLDGDGGNGRGPNLDEVAQVAKAISGALDDSPVMGEAPYVLEVSSRGVTKPLIKSAHFRRNTGRLVAFTLVSGEKFTGRIVQASDDTVGDVMGEAITVLVEESPRIVTLTDVATALVQVELNSPLAATPDEDDEDGDADGIEESELWEEEA